ncbi:MAG TPA: hypothetical protein VNO31_34075, partial [Umezawaea sp.]|nr:hypothetical protein [Umezawaea sp.]
MTAFNAASEHPWRCLVQHHLVEVLVRFHYETGPDVDVTMSADACFASTNGARAHHQPGEHRGLHRQAARHA